MRWQGMVALVAGVVLLCAPARAETTDDLAGTTWRADDIDGRGVVDFLQSTITFGADGQVAGRAGCNRYFGAWTRDGAKVTMGPFGSTRMACEPAVQDQEDRFLQALGAVDRVEIRNGLLYLYAGDQARVRLSPSHDPELKEDPEPATRP